MKPPLIPIWLLRLKPPIGCSPLLEVVPGMPLPKPMEWAEPVLAKLKTDMQQVKAHLPESAAMFNGQNGSLVVAEGGIEHWLKHLGVNNPDDYSRTIGIALPYRSGDGIRRNAIVLNHHLYTNPRPGNTLAHDVERGLSDTTSVATGLHVASPRTGFHSKSKLFGLAYDLEEVLKPNGYAANMTDYLKTSTYQPSQYRDEQFANTIGYLANHQLGYSPLLSQYSRDVFRPDMLLKAEGREAVRARLGFAFNKKPEEIVGDKLAPLIEKWQGGKAEVEEMENAGRTSRVQEAKQQLHAVETYMRQTEIADQLRKAVGAYMEQLIPNVEIEAARLERFSGSNSVRPRPR